MMERYVDKAQSVLLNGQLVVQYSGNLCISMLVGSLCLQLSSLFIL